MSIHVFEYRTNCVLYIFLDFGIKDKIPVLYLFIPSNPITKLNVSLLQLVHSKYILEYICCNSGTALIQRLKVKSASPQDPYSLTWRKEKNN